MYRLLFILYISAATMRRGSVNALCIDVWTLPDSFRGDESCPTPSNSSASCRRHPAATLSCTLRPLPRIRLGLANAAEETASRDIEYADTTLTDKVWRWSRTTPPLPSSTDSAMRCKANVPVTNKTHVPSV